MLPKIKKFIKANKKEVKLGLLILIILILLLVLYKMLFYSDSEKSIYGPRLNGINENKITNEEKIEFKDKVSKIEGITKTRIEVKGRLIKIYTTFDEQVSNEDIKNKFNEMLTFINDDIKSYYDITFYAKQVKEEKNKYPVVGYKQKGKELISFDEF